MNENAKTELTTVEQNQDNTYAKFVVEPLPRGYGITIGNSLRRILLSSLPGAAVTSIKVDGTPHEFSTIPGVVEDVTQIILNIKGVHLKLHNADTAQITIDRSDKGVVYAGDIIHGSDIEILNPEQPIATLNGQGRLYIEMNVGVGTGWRPADKNKSDKIPFGTIPIDSIFAPVPKVNFTVEDTRVGNVTDYNKLTLEIWTNGAMTPADALSMSAKILIEQFSLFAGTSVPSMTFDLSHQGGNSSENSQLNKPIEEIELSVRSSNCLKRANIKTVGDLVAMTEDELSRVRNLGKKSLEEIIEKLGEMGFQLKSNDNK
ncbi:MAG: DNA-directed RNA polymerase subunit alpha [Clostridia bacterium]|nr:DNA-directed RNA polymerase subunit alpha [Clostridia bacterium]